jgi:acetyltransferase-like isoleucine patch superfamily enzyme
MLGHLWRRRLKPPFGSRLWLKQWAKRLWTLRSMLSFALRTYQLKRRGAIIGNGSVVSPLRLGGHCRLLRIGSDSFLGRVEIQLAAEVEIGSHVCINDGVRLITASHDVRSSDWRRFAKAIRIHDHTWIATGAVVLPGVTIGKGAVVGAYAVVAKDIPDYAVAAGNPARVRENVRNPDLHYSPTSFLAFQTAWLGTPTTPASLSGR